jgi:lysophospholipase L1-like esterase
MDFYTPEHDLQRNQADGTESAGLPSVLLLGDSISQGYTPIVRELLADKCNVLRPRANCGDTKAGLRYLDDWLAGRHWDIIHFNWGLHDLCHRHPDSILYGNRDKENGLVSVPLDLYRANLDILVKRLQKGSDRLIWANTTVIPTGEAGRFEGDELRYNEVAQKVMQKHGVMINNLYKTTVSFPASMFVAPCDVHFSEEGYTILARQVADHVLKAMALGAGR